MGMRSRDVAGASASSPATPDDAALAVLLLRQAAVSDVVQLFQQLEARDAPRRTVAITTQQALAREARGAEAALRRRSRPNGDAEGSEQQSGDCDPHEGDDTVLVPALGDLEELVGDLLELHALSADGCLSPLESDLTHALELTVSSALVQAALGDASQPYKRELGDVRMWLLELAVRPSAVCRQLAFALFFDLSVRVTAIEVARLTEVAVEEARGERVQTQLFQVLLEMLGKAVVVASSSRESVASRAPRDSELSWIAKARSCVFLFVRSPRGGFCAERLRALDPQVVRFFLRESTSSLPDDELLELLVFTMYAQESVVAVSSSAAIDKPKQLRPLTRFSLPQAALERFGGLELLLTHFYNSASLVTQRLLFMVFFDVACHQQQAQLKSPDAAAAAQEDELWRLFQRCSLPSVVASMPTVLIASGSARTVKKLYALAPPALTPLISEKQLGQFVGHLRGVLHVDEYFAQSSSLGNTIKLLRDQKKHDAADALAAKVAHLLSSSRAEDRFQGERWLAELVSFGLSPCASSSDAVRTLPTRQRGAVDQLSESVIFTGSDTDLESSLLGVPSSGDELEETCCFDEDASVRLSARSKFWELAKSPTTTLRESFARTLTAFVKRKLCLTQNQESGLAAIAREVNACLSVVVEQQESSERVLAPLLCLAIDICKTDVSKQDTRRQEYDRSCARSSEDALDLRLSSYDSDSLASCFASGAIALDASLLGMLDPDFFARALLVLEQASHPRRRCRQRCCGSRSRSPLTSDLAVCAALLLGKLHGSDAVAHKWGDRVRVLLPLAEACHTRVAVVVSRLIVSAMKRSDESKYMAALRELHVRAVDTDDADLLFVEREHRRQPS